MIAFGEEHIEACWDEFMPLAQRFWEETNEQGVFLPDKHRYLHYDRNGYFAFYTIRDDGRLIGYVGFFVLPDLKTQIPGASEDHWFILPEYRRDWTMWKFFHFVEESLARFGVRDITMMVPEGVRTGPTLRRLKYKAIGQVYQKEIQHEQA